MAERMTIDDIPNGEAVVAEVAPHLESQIKKIDGLDDIEKFKIYMHYFITKLCDKHTVAIEDTFKTKWEEGHDEPYKIFKGIAFFHDHQDVEIKDSHSFFSHDNIEIEDCGQDWKEQGLPYRWKVKASGAYSWCTKFKKEIEEF